MQTVLRVARGLLFSSSAYRFCVSKLPTHSAEAARRCARLSHGAIHFVCAVVIGVFYLPAAIFSPRFYLVIFGLTLAHHHRYRENPAGQKACNRRGHTAIRRGSIDSCGYGCDCSVAGRRHGAVQRFRRTNQRDPGAAGNRTLPCAFCVRGGDFCGRVSIWLMNAAVDGARQRS